MQAQRNSQQKPLPLQMVVVCRSEEIAAHWHRQAENLKGIELIIELGCRCYYQLLDRIINEPHPQPVLVAHDDIQCGLGFARALAELIKELDENYANWGVCGNAGISWDGRQIYRFIKDPHGGPQNAMAPEFVLGIDGNLMLLNVPALAAAAVRMPELRGFQGYDISLSLECLRKGLPVLCDRRLFVMHKSGGNGEEFQKFVISEPFQTYLARHFLNHSVPTINGAIDTCGAQDYRYLDIPGEKTAQKDLVALFDQALGNGLKRRPSLTVGCRSQFNRPELLTRAFASFAVAAQQAADLVDIQVRIISDKPVETMQAEIKRLRNLFPGLNLAGCSFTLSAERYSRMEALLKAVEQAETDYIWFVDDDDFIFPDAMRTLARVLLPGVPRLLVGQSVRIQEYWVTNRQGERVIMNNTQIGRYLADGVYHSFAGDNHTPICSLIFPVAALRRRIAPVAALGDYYEDYFLLLLVWSANPIEIRLIHEDLCGISLREGENTVTEPCRDHWDLSYTTFVSELLRHPDGTNPLLWQIAERIGAPAAPLQIIAAGQAGQTSRSRLARLLEPGEGRRLVRRFQLFRKTCGFKAAIRQSLQYIFPR